MSFTPLSDRYLRIATIALCSLALLTYLGPVLDFTGEVQAFLGRINNLSSLTAILYILLFIAVPARMRGPWERRTLLAAGVLFAYGVTISAMREVDVLVTYGGLTMLLGAISAGAGAYSLAKSGKGIHRRLLGVIIATVPALALPVAFIAYDPAAYPSFMLKVYGYSNIRVFGYFAAAAVVVLAGLTASAWASRKPSVIFLQLAGLTLSWSFLFWSGGRAGMIATALAIPLAWAICRRVSWSELALVPLTALSGAWISSFYYAPGKWFGLANRVTETARNLEKGGVAKASSNRLDMWQWVIEHILERPLTGHGYLPMAHLRSEEFNYFHSHNVVLEYLMSFGLIAGTLMLALAIALQVRASIAAFRIGTPVARALLMLATLLPIYALFSATLFFPFHLMIYMLAIGALIGLDVHARLPQSEEEPFRAKADWMFDEA